MGHEDGLTIILYILKLIGSAGTCPHKGACSSATKCSVGAHLNNGVTHSLFFLFIFNFNYVKDIT